MPTLVRRGNQGQIPAVNSPLLCQLLRKSEREPPTEISEGSGYNECGNGFVFVVCEGESGRSETVGAILVLTKNLTAVPLLCSVTQAKGMLRIFVEPSVAQKQGRLEKREGG